ARESPGEAEKTRFLQAGLASASDAAVAAGGLAAVFTGNGIEVVDAAGGQPLWRSESSPARLAWTTPGAVWLSEPGKLIARSPRSGRELRSIALPENAYVVETFT